MITYNHEKYISQAIESVLMQKTNFSLELVIGEDCSADTTRKICIDYKNKYPDFIKLSLPDKNLGMVSNFIYTLLTCTGKYIALCEGDDCWTDPYKLQKQVDFLDKNPEYSLVHSDIVLIDTNGENIPDDEMVTRLRHYSSKKSTIDTFDLLEGNLINTLTVCARGEFIRQLLKEMKVNNVWFSYDYFIWLNLGLEGKIYRMNDKMAAYRIHPNTYTCRHPWVAEYGIHSRYYIIKKLFNQKKLCCFERDKTKILAKIILSLITCRAFITFKQRFFLVKVVLGYPRIGYFLVVQSFIGISKKLKKIIKT
jgi:glycosyltransferase involved in cell wall biosynthesis